MKTLAELLRDSIETEEDYSPAKVIVAVQEWLTAMSQDGQVPANRDLRDEYKFLIREAAK